MIRIDKINRYFNKKAQSKRGFTLVEAAASVMILAIVCAGVLNAVAFSREMVFSNNAREKASDKAQLVADEIISAAMGENPKDASALNVIVARVNDITTNSLEGTTNIQADAIGVVTQVDEFHEPANENELIQYIITPVETAADVERDTDVTVNKIKQKVTVHDVVVEGWNINVRVYYKMIGSGGTYRVVDVSGFAPRDFAAD